MHLWQVKSNPQLLIVSKADQPGLYFFVVEKGEFIFSKTRSLVDARFFIEVIIFAEVVPVNDLVNQFAAFATEHLVI